MQLSQSEVIQILRKRAGLNQAELGSRAFDINAASGRTKIKNIELGKQRITDDDLERIARCLDVPVVQLQSTSENKASDANRPQGGILISNKLANMFPDLSDYLEMLENAAKLNDLELIEYLSNKIADIWRDGPKLVSQAQDTLTKST